MRAARDSQRQKISPRFAAWPDSAGNELTRESVDRNCVEGSADILSASSQSASTHSVCCSVRPRCAAAKAATGRSSPSLTIRIDRYHLNIPFALFQIDFSFEGFWGDLRSGFRLGFGVGDGDGEGEKSGLGEAAAATFLLAA